MRLAAEKVFVFMSLQDDYVRIWDENQGPNDSKLERHLSDLVVKLGLFGPAESNTPCTKH